MKKIKFSILIAVGVLMTLSMSSCTNDLNVTPLQTSILSPGKAFSSDTAYTNFLAKVYAGFSTTGIQAVDNNVDIQGIDGGSQASYVRALWNLQELPTEEAMCAWNDQTIQNFHTFSWSSSDPFILGFYDRLYFQITIATSFLQQTTPAALSANKVSSAMQATIKTYRAEARFLRALAYYNVLDNFRNGPMVTDDSPIGSSAVPPYAKAPQIYAYISSELRSCVNDMLPPVVGFGPTYGHANQAAAWSLLAKLYLNANTYLGTSNTQYYDSCLTYCNKVISAGYQLNPVYQNNFVSDNYNSPEIIFPIVFDGTHAQSWGGMMFLMSSAVSGDIQSITASPGAWGGNRATKDFVAKFSNTAQNENASLDSRAKMLYTGFNHPSIDDNSQFKQGTPVLKYSEKNSQGVAPNPAPSFPDTDFPVFRLADIYLMYAEAVLRGGHGGDMQTALNYVNALRDRAEGGGFTDLEISANQLTLPFILEERSRELFWECTRRTDLVRYGLLTSPNYVWQWKGGVKSGVGASSIYNIYPIPSSDLSANPNLIQNTGF
ncbi:MAG: RagB/SusD family nutrient uptake outer membrane protein [Microbacter sp.]